MRRFNGFKVKVAMLSFIAVSAVFVRYCHGDGSGEKGLRVYLPREVVVKDDSIALGSVGVMRGDEVLVARASKIGLGRFALSGQQIVIDRRTILSRLASNGIDGGEVVLSGAERVTVKRDEEAIEGGRFDEVAESFLISQGRVRSANKVILVKKAKDWILSSGAGEIELVPRMSRYGTRDKAKVWVGVVQDGVEVGGCEVIFNLRYKCRRAVALVDIRVGTLIDTRNVRVETVEMNSPEKAGWREPYGLVARQRIKAGGVISGNMVGPEEMPVVIKRRQKVVLRIEAPGLYVTALGESLSEGKVGENIRVKVGIGRSGRIVVGTIQSDGTVKPVY